MKRSYFAALAWAALCSSAVAQIAPLAHTVEPVELDSGYVGNSSSSSAVVFRGVVQGGDVAWMQLHFESTNLPTGSRLKLTSAFDGAVQWFDGGSLRDYNDRSAYFNGNQVTVELHAAASSVGNRVRVGNYASGSGYAATFGLLSQCGPVDDRVPSQDPRAGRTSPTGCTAWMMNPTTAISAGHCGGPNDQIHFNVPLSTSSGSYVMPPPDDQYAFDSGTFRRLSGGVGADWAVVAIHRNSNTGLYPGQAQGSWYNLGPVPTTGPAHIRITGYGTTTSSVPRSWNGAQKTHVGGLASVGSTSLRYRADTTGGNSGSPVIHEETGLAVGVHTHAGCNFSGGSNQGTRIDRSDFANAITATENLRVAGVFESFGSGCAGSAGNAALSSDTFPDLGSTMTLDVAGVEPNMAGTMFFGASSINWLGNPLPFNLAGAGFPNCNVEISLDVAVPLATGSFGTPSLSFNVPNSGALTGNVFYCQYLNLDSGAGLTTSNGGKITIGE